MGEPITLHPNAPDIESSTAEYATRFEGYVGEWMLSKQRKATEDAILKIFPNATTLNVLDVGGGHAQNVALLNELGHKVTVVGSDESCNNMLQNRINNGEVLFRVGSLVALPFTDGSFDLVICYRVLSHMELWQQLVAELTRVSKKAVLIDYPSYWSVNIFSKALYHVKKRIEKNTRPFQCFRDREIDQAFKLQGAIKKYKIRQFFMPMAFHRLVNRLFISKTFHWLFRSIGLSRVLGSPVIAAYVKDKSQEH